MSQPGKTSATFFGAALLLSVAALIYVDNRFIEPKAADRVAPAGNREIPAPEPGFHRGPIRRIDLNAGCGQVVERMNTLQGCLERGYSQLYADLSVLIAKVGRSRAGWSDGVDGRAPADDPGRGVSNWSAHATYWGASGNGAKLVCDRLTALRAEVPADEVADLERDLAEVMDRYSGMPNCGRPTRHGR